MNKKVGPLELWQWGAVLIAVAVAVYVYEQYKANQAATTATTPGGDTTTGATSAGVPDTSGSGSVDNSTGLPTDTGSTDTGGGVTSGLSQELSDLGAIQGLEQNFADMAANGNGAAGNVPQITVNVPGIATGTSKKRKPPSTGKTSGKGSNRQRTGSNNPGHVVTNTNNGRQHVTSSAPTNNRQHTNVSPPQHQAQTKAKPSIGASLTNLRAATAPGQAHVNSSTHPANGNATLEQSHATTHPPAVHPEPPKPPAKGKKK